MDGWMNKVLCVWDVSCSLRVATLNFIVLCACHCALCRQGYILTRKACYEELLNASYWNWVNHKATLLVDISQPI